MEGKR